MTEPYYDEDVVNLGYFKKQIDTTNKEIEEATKNVSKHYGSQPVPPYSEGDTWNDGETIYTCINGRLAGNYVANDWKTESGALDLAKSKSKTYLTQPTNYKLGDTWILQSNSDHTLGKKGEILIASRNGTQYIASDWVKELTYVTQDEKTTINNTLQTAVNDIADLKTTATSITARVTSTEARLNNTYTKEEIEGMNQEMLDDLDVVSQQVGELEITSGEIISSVSQVATTMSEEYASKEELNTQMTETAEQFKFEINSAISNLNENGISKVDTATVTIDKEGILVGKSNSGYVNRMNNTGNYQYYGGELTAKYDKDGAEIPKLKTDIAIIAGIKYVKRVSNGVTYHETYVLE